ncbi:MAG: efflux RND transporter permease subunit [Sphingomonadales bacterium]|nr:efflux RND transporter permease subunit [Sphingomonadales bacterium]
MNALIRAAVTRWQITALLTALVVALGIGAFHAIPRTEDPQLNSPIYLITVVVPGGSPDDMEQQVAKPIEEALGSIDDLRDLNSWSGNDVVTLRAEFNWGADPERRYDEVVRELNALRPRLPTNLSRLEIMRGRNTAVPFVQAALTSDLLPPDRLEKLARRLKDRIARVPGVRKAEVVGAGAGEMRVSLDFQKLAVLHIPAGAVIDALHAAGAESPVGTVHAGERRLVVRTGGVYPDAAAVAAVPVARRNGVAVRVADVARVEWAQREDDHRIRFNGRRAALVTAEQIDGRDVRLLTRDVEAQLDAFERELPGSVRLERGFTQASNLKHRLDQLTRDFVLAIAIVALTLLPLGLRAAGVVMVAVPLSLLIGVAVMWHMGFTLNQLSVAGFILSLGLLVDDAIVVVENIARWLRGGASRAEAAIGATSEIALAVIGCTACLGFAFLPLIAMPEAAGEFVRSLPVAVLGTVAGSLLVALTLIPFIASRVLPRHSDPHGNRLLQALTRGIQRLYAPALHAALARPGRAVAWLGGLSLLTIPVVMLIGTSLFPAADLPQFLVEVALPRGTSMDRADQAVQAVAHRIAAEPGIAWTAANIGRGNPSIYYNRWPRPVDASSGEIAAAFHLWNPATSPRAIARLRHDLAGTPGAEVTIHTFMQGPPIEAPVAIRIAGPDMGVLTRLARQSEGLLKAMPELRDIGDPLRLDRTELDLGIDQALAAGLGVPAGAARQVTQLALVGAPAALLRDADGDGYPVTVRLPMAGQRNDIAALGQVQVPTDSGGTVPLSAISSPTLRSGPAQIERYNRERVVTLTADVRDGVQTSRATAKAVATLQSALKLPPGYRLMLAGEAQSQERSFAGLTTAIAVALLGIMAVLVLEFGRFRTVAVVAGVIPLGLLGAVVALGITGNSLSFTASVGVIALTGIEIKNSILLVDFTEQMRRAGASVREAVEKAGELRFLPVLLTSITAIGGLLPLALERNGLYSPVAIAMIGGLLSSTLLARIATPVLYLLLNPEAPPA